MWHDGDVVTALALAIKRSRVRFSLSALSCAALTKPLCRRTCLCHQAVYVGTGQTAVMLCGQEGNRRHGVK